MLKKLSLDKTKTYERCIALEQITQMTCDFVMGRSYKQEIGAEQGDILKWDDFVMVNEDGSKTYIQVKRQSTDFWSQVAGETVERNTDKYGKIRKLSEFDETMEALAKICQESNHDKDSFRIYLPSDSTYIKKEIKIRNLRNFKDSIKSITLGSDLERQVTADTNTKNVAKWLKSWCGFTDYDHIVKAFKMFNIYMTGYETDIMDRVKSNLKEIFIDSKDNSVHDRILSFMEDNSTYAGAFRPRQLLFELKEYIRPDISLWTLFKANQSSWIVSGINDLESEEEEKAPMVVSAVWNSKSRCNLKIAGEYSEKCKLAKSLMRLSIHQNGANYTSASDKTLWTSYLKKSVGETLGNGKNDCNDINIFSIDKGIDDINGKTISSFCDKEQYAEDLNDAMYNKRHDELGLKINDLKDSNEKIRLSALVDENNITDEKLRLEQGMNQQKSVISMLQQKSGALPMLEENKYNIAQENKDSQERKIKENRLLIDSIKLDIANENSVIEILKKKLEGKDVNQYLQKVATCFSEIKESSERLHEYSNRYNVLREAIDKIDTGLRSEENNVSILKATQDSILEEWKHFKIDSVPDVEKKDARCNELNNLDKELENDLTRFYELKNALLEWKNYEAGEDIKKKIKNKIGDDCPDTFYEKNKEQIAKKKAELDNIKIRKAAVNAFLDKISEESEQIQIQFGQINETWKKILKRIVVNPLISSAPLLNNKTSRNRQIASTVAEINGEKFDISNIASEGQIADLQLSFILAMANKYSWTPWKALLLDDPMQHHDLVHASSAFDVLRDYITELDYQVMLSTHDPLQADFFVRKLKNDGIPSKVYQLVPGKGGVTAERVD